MELWQNQSEKKSLNKSWDGVGVMAELEQKQVFGEEPEKMEL